MSRAHQALVLAALLIWQALAWAAPWAQRLELQTLAHAADHQDLAAHHHHQDATIHWDEVEGAELHIHADVWAQTLGLVPSMGWPWVAAVACIAQVERAAELASVCLEGLLRPPQWRA